MLTVSQIMTPDPSTVSPNTPLIDVIGIMKEHNCRQLPVVNDELMLVGIITDRDVRLALNSPLTLHERADDKALVHQLLTDACMTINPLTIDGDAPIIEAAELLAKYKFGSLPVISDAKVIGIVTTTDILQSYVQVLEEDQ